MDDADRAYLTRVRAEIDEEVRRRRASGDIPPQLESELEQLFLRHAPLGDTRQELHDVLRLVDAAAFIDPVVPVASSLPGGAVVKKSIRSMNFWYLRFITHQISQFTTAVSRSLHILDHQLNELADQGGHRRGPALGGGRRRLGPSPRRLVGPGRDRRAGRVTAPGAARRLRRRMAGGRARGRPASTATGSIPGPGAVAAQELGDLDLREEPVVGHLAAVEPGALAGVVLTGLMEGSGHGERRRLARRGGGGPGPRRCPGRPLPGPVELGRGRRSARSGPGAGPALPARHLVPPDRRPRAGGDGDDGGRRPRLSGSRPSADAVHPPVTPKVAFVTPRYGPEVMGGAEAAARQLAEHLAADCGWSVEVFTTCALDHITWDDVLPPGDSVENGVTVHRFRSASGRVPEFYELDGRLRPAPAQASMAEARRWLETNGPVTLDLVDALRAADADVVAFYPYLYYPTVVGMEVVSVPRVLHPAAHDEPALYLPVFEPTYRDADAICYHTAAERRLVQRIHPVAQVPQIVLGLGVGAVVEGGRPGGEILGIGDRPYVVSVGRVDEHKGSVMLARFFALYKERHPGPLALALVGPVTAEIAPHPDIVLTGVVSEADKWDLVRDALVAVSPSALESFSLVVLEAWEQSVPVIVNATCDPTREHCERSGGGLWFDSFREFEVVLERLCCRRSDSAASSVTGATPTWRSTTSGPH